MNTMRKLLVFAGTIFATAFVQAQVTPDFMAVEAGHNNVQTGWSSTTAQTYSAGVAGPFSFKVWAESNGGGDLSGNTPPTFTIPSEATYAGSKTLGPNGKDWRFSEYYSSSPFSADFPNGTYTITQPGVSPGTVTLNLASNLFPITPLVTITGGSGTWVGSVLQVTPGTTLTLTTNLFGWDETGAETNGALANHIGLFLSHNGTEVGSEGFSNGANPYFGSGTGNPNFATISNYTFISGNYYVEAEFNAISDIDNLSYPGATGVALYTTRTSFNIQVIPEPSTYAAILGALALAGAMIRRRRQLA